MKTCHKLQSVRNLLVFLDFTNYYKRFIKNVNKIVISFTLILQIMDDKISNTQATENEKNQDI